MNRRVLHLESRLADTRVAGTRVQASGEAKRAAIEIQRAFDAIERGILVADPSVVLLRWKDDDSICNVQIDIEFDVARVTVNAAEDIVRDVLRRLRDDAYR